jgi:dynein heavy chain, axonemal
LGYESFKFSTSGKYFCPPPGDRNSYLEYIKTLPTMTSPEVFGLHDNAEITTAQNEASALLETVLGMQPRASSSGGKSVETVLYIFIKGN